MKKFVSKKVFILLVFCSLMVACGGGSSDSGMLIEGTLTEAGGAAHSKLLELRHSDGQRISEVQICALGECSLTDGEGQWGFVAADDFSGGEILFSIKGHGIDAQFTIHIPADAKEVFLDLQHVEGGAVEAQHVTVDGETEHHEDH